MNVARRISAGKEETADEVDRDLTYASAGALPTFLARDR